MKKTWVRGPVHLTGPLLLTFGPPPEIDFFVVPDDLEQTNKYIFLVQIFFFTSKFFEKNIFPLFFIIGVRALIFGPSR